MPTLKLRIPGRFWDSYLYSGRLYLFGLDGDIQTLNWDQLIEDWHVPDSEKLALHCAFRKSDYLYGAQFADLLLDPEIRQLLRDKFDHLTARTLELTRQQFGCSLIDRQDNPCPFPHADAELYRRNLYVVGGSGVFRATCNKRTRYPISTKPERKWDCPVLSASALCGTLALATGPEGLFELSINGTFAQDHTGEPSLLESKLCHKCSWTFHSIYGSSFSSPGFLASFRKHVESLPQGQRLIIREFLKTLSEEEIFSPGHGFSWGVRDKLCKARPGAIEVVRYQPWSPLPEEQFIRLGTQPLAQWKGEVVDAGTALFGVILECENALVVYPSIGTPVTIQGEPVNWRVFPRSKHYENQLHVVWGDCLEIYSFNQDYLVDQDQKYFGSAFFPVGERVIVKSCV